MLLLLMIEEESPLEWNWYFLRVLLFSFSSLRFLLLRRLSRGVVVVVVVVVVIRRLGLALVRLEGHLEHAVA